MEAVFFFFIFLFTQRFDMETSVSPLQITNITLQGAVMALCLELTIRSLFLPASQKSWLVRSLKITMAVTMMIKSGIFTAFNSK
jgi:hypothetical protein